MNLNTESLFGKKSILAQLKRTKRTLHLIISLIKLNF